VAPGADRSPQRAFRGPLSPEPAFALEPAIPHQAFDPEPAVPRAGVRSWARCPPSRRSLLGPPSPTRRSICRTIVAGRGSGGSSVAVPRRRTFDMSHERGQKGSGPGSASIERRRTFDMSNERGQKGPRPPWTACIERKMTFDMSNEAPGIADQGRTGGSATDDRPIGYAGCSPDPATEARSHPCPSRTPARPP
jgi:hypothetical protein